MQAVTIYSRSGAIGACDSSCAANVCCEHARFTLCMQRVCTAMLQSEMRRQKRQNQFKPDAPQEARTH